MQISLQPSLFLRRALPPVIHIRYEFSYPACEVGQPSGAGIRSHPSVRYAQPAHAVRRHSCVPSECSLHARSLPDDRAILPFARFTTILPSPTPIKSPDTFCLCNTAEAAISACSLTTAVGILPECLCLLCISSPYFPSAAISSICFCNFPVCAVRCRMSQLKRGNCIRTLLLGSMKNMW